MKLLIQIQKYKPFISGLPGKTTPNLQAETQTPDPLTETKTAETTPSGRTGDSRPKTLDSIIGIQTTDPNPKTGLQ